MIMIYNDKYKPVFDIHGCVQNPRSIQNFDNLEDEVEFLASDFGHSLYYPLYCYILNKYLELIDNKKIKLELCDEIAGIIAAVKEKIESKTMKT